MANDNAHDVDRAWELMKKIGFAMLVTHDGDKLRARPMSAYLEPENNAVYFLSDVRRHKDEEIAKNPASTYHSLTQAIRNTSRSLALPWRRMIAPRSSNCSQRRPKHGGIRPRIPTSVS